MDHTPTNEKFSQFDAPMASSSKCAKYCSIEISVTRQDEVEEEKVDAGKDSPVGGLGLKKVGRGRGRREGWTIGASREGEGEGEEEEEANLSIERVVCNMVEGNRLRKEEEVGGKRQGNIVHEIGRAIDRKVWREQQIGAVLKALVIVRKVRTDDRAVEVMQVGLKSLTTSS